MTLRWWLVVIFLVLGPLLGRAQSAPYTYDFDAVDTSFHLYPSGDSLAWKAMAGGGVSSSRCLLSEWVTNATGANEIKYYASKRLSLTAGNTYQVSFSCRAQYADRRQVMLGINTTDDRATSTLVHDFGTLTSVENYQAYSTTFSVGSSGHYYLIYYAQALTSAKDCRWYTDDFAVTLVNTPPTAALFAPAANAVFDPDQVVVLTATVADAESNISKVEFYSGATKVGEATSPAFGGYSAMWTPANGGQHMVTAKATDSYGATGTSTSRTLTVRHRPVTTLLHPAHHETYFEGPRTLEASASDPDGSIVRMVFYVGADSVGVDTTAPYTLDWNAVPTPENEWLALTAKAVDDDGLTGSATAEIQITALTCTLTGVDESLHQFVCPEGITKLTTNTNYSAGSAAWYGRPPGGEWALLTDQAETRQNQMYNAGPGQYRVVWTYPNLATCTTAVDVVDRYRTHLQFTVSACAARLTALAPNHIASPGYSPGGVAYTWDIQPGYTNQTLPATDGDDPEGDYFFTHANPGLHTVVLTSANGECMWNDTATVSIDSLIVVADTIFTYNGQPALATAHTLNGTAPYSYTWSSMDSCLTSNCDSVLVSDFNQTVTVTVGDGRGCVAVSDIKVYPSNCNQVSFYVLAKTRNSLSLKIPSINGTSFLLVCRKGQPVNFIPQNLISYVANPIFGAGEAIGQGQHVVHSGELADSIIVITNLDSLTGYYFALFRTTAGQAIYCTTSSNLYGITSGTFQADSDPVPSDEDLHNYLVATKRATRSKITDRLLNPGESQIVDNGQEIVIPVVFHFIGSEGSLAIDAANSDCRLRSAISGLNDGFGNLAATAFNGSKPNAMGIRFCLAQHRYNSEAWPEKPGVMVYTGNTVPSKAFEGAEVYNPLVYNWYQANIFNRFPSRYFLNIIVLESLENPSWAAIYASGHDAVFLRHIGYGSNSPAHRTDNSCDEALPFLLDGGFLKILTHEVGHLLTLEHTFEGGCSSNNEPCAIQGDGVCDTAPADYQVGLSSCGTIVSCGHTRSNDNFMDYTDDVCRKTFTASDPISQRGRMRSNALNDRQDMLSHENLYTVLGGSSCVAINPFAKLKIRRGSFLNCSIENNSIDLMCTEVYGASTYAFHITNDQGGDWNIPPTSSRTVTFPQNGEFPQNGTYSVTCTVTYGVPEQTQVYVVTRANMFRFMTCTGQGEIGTWYLQNKSTLGFSENGPFQVWPTSLHNSPTFTAHSPTGEVLFYTDSYRLYGKDNLPIPQFFNGNTGIGNAINSLVDVVEIDASNYILAIIAYPGLNPDDNPGTLTFHRVRRLGINWTVIQIGDEIEIGKGTVKFASSCHAGEVMRFLHFDYDNNAVQTFALNPVDQTWTNVVGPTMANLSLTMQFSNDGAHLVGDNGYIFHYNSATNQLTEQKRIHFDQSSIGLAAPIFSPSGHYIYWMRKVLGQAVLYRGLVTEGCQVTNEKSIVVPGGSSTTFAIGPDGILYFPYHTSLLAAIVNTEPQSPQSEIEINLSAVEFFETQISTQFTYQPFRNAASVIPYITVCQACSTVKAYTNLCPEAGSSTLTWTFGDGQTEMTDANTVSHTFTTGGPFTFTVSNGGVPNPRSIISVIQPVPPVLLTNPPNFMPCGQFLILEIANFSPLTTSYKWYFREDGPFGTYNQIASLTNGRTIEYTFLRSGTLKITYAPTVSGCAGGEVTVHVNVNPETDLQVIMPNLDLCAGTPLFLEASSDSHSAILDWVELSSDNITGVSDCMGCESHLQNLATGTIASQPGVVIYRVTATKEHCATSHTDIPIRLLPPIHSVMGVGNVSVCNGVVLNYMLPSVAGVAYTWDHYINSGGISGMSSCSSSCGNSIDQTLTATGPNLLTGASFGSYHVFQTTTNTSCEADVNIEMVYSTLQISGNCTENERLITVAPNAPTYDRKYTWNRMALDPEGPNDFDPGFTPVEGISFDVFSATPSLIQEYVVRGTGVGCTTDEYRFHVVSTAPTGIVQGKNIYIQQDNLTLASSSFNQTTLRMMGLATYATPEPGGTISPVTLTIPEGEGVTFTQSTLTSGCQNMWGGIIVQDGAALTLQNSTISHAHRAVDILASPDLLAIQGCTLANNLYGVRIQDHVQATTSPIIEDNVFTSQPNDMKAPFDFAHNRNIQVAGSILQNRGRFLTRNGIEIGVNHQVTTSVLQGNQFENCVTGVEVVSRPSGLFDFAINLNTYSQCTWAGIRTPAYGLVVNYSAFTLPTDQSLVTTWQCQTARGETFTHSSSLVLPVYGILCRSGSTDGLKTVSNCAFSGSANAAFSQMLPIGISADIAGQIVQNGFQYLSTAVEILSPADHPLSLNRNIFTDNQTSIWLRRWPGVNETVSLDFTLKCNKFENTPQSGSNPVIRKGLVIGEGVRLRAPDDGSFMPDQIGGQNAIDINNPNIAYPNANVWPTAQVDRGIRPMIGPVEQNLHSATGWANSPNWVAIDNQTSTQINYVRYNNEFVGWGTAISGLMDFPYPAQTELKIATAGDGVEPGTPGYDFACGNFSDPQVVLFPARIAVVPADVTEVKSAHIMDEALLNDAMPNPSREETRIGLYLPAKAESAVLQILETGTGKVLQNIPVAERGKLEVLLDTRTAPAAIYTYRLLVDGKTAGVKRLVVQH